MIVLSFPRAGPDTIAAKALAWPTEPIADGSFQPLRLPTNETSLLEFLLVTQFPYFRVVRLLVQLSEARDVLQEVGLVEDAEEEVCGEGGAVVGRCAGADDAPMFCVLNLGQAEERADDDRRATRATIKRQRRRRNLLVARQETTDLWTRGYEKRVKPES